jgi:V8-like Glu-specific endopeptidase
MKFTAKLSVIAIAILSASCLTANAASTSDYPIHNNNPEATLSYWTPERLKSAKPMDLPKVKGQVQQTTLDPNVPSESAEAASPIKTITPENSLLYPKEDSNLKTSHSPLKNVGTSGLHFTSSRLVPLTADLSYPYTTTGKLFFTQTGVGNFVCSASVIANRLVVTAGHCVHSGTNGDAGFYTNFMFIPAFRDGTAPLQRWVWSFVNTTNAWKTGQGRVPNAGDFAILEMKDNVVSGQNVRIGDVTGKLGFATNKLSANHVHMLGYPCNFDSCQKMHQVTSRNGGAVSPNNVQYGSDMEGGASGGPWIQNFGSPSPEQTGGLNRGLNQVVAVTSWGYGDPNNQLVLGASNFNNTFTTLYNQMCTHQTGNC